MVGNNQTGTKVPFPGFLDNVDNKEQSQRLCSYVHNLRDRLRWATQQNQEAIQLSTQVLKEVGDISAMLSLTNTTSQTPATRHLIKEFQTISEGNVSLDPTAPEINISRDMAETRDLLLKFEALNESAIFAESIVGFKRAGESLEMVLRALDKSKPHASQLGANPQTHNQLSVKRNLREKIETFNNTVRVVDTCRHFNNCFRTAGSTEELNNASEGFNLCHILSKTNSGYEGDVDTEAELAEISSHTQ